MGDLYDEVMSLLYDTGAFADWQKDAELARSAGTVRHAARREMLAAAVRDKGSGNTGPPAPGP